MPPPTRVVLSDLDDTLFDHAHATRAAQRIVAAATPALAAWRPEDLERRHREVLDELHLEVLAGRLTVDDARIERFRRLLEEGGARGTLDLARQIARDYRHAYEIAWQPVPGAIALLTHLRSAGLPIVVVTNNIVLEQRQKIARVGLDRYIDELVTSEEVGITKPSPGIFVEALRRVRARADEAVMIGDAWSTDVEGARAAGVRAVWLNRFDAVAPDPAVAMLRSLEPIDDAVRVILGR
jgi:HAD superfamily hydrolase (TIGR01662 family)